MTSGTATHQASLSFTISQSLLKLMSIELVMPSNYFILCHPLFLLPSIFPSLRVFSNESALWSNILVHLTRSIASQSIYTYIFLSGDYCFFGLFDNWPELNYKDYISANVHPHISAYFIFLDFIFMIGFPGCSPVFTELNLLKVELRHLKRLLLQAHLCINTAIFKPLPALIFH